MSAVSSPAHLEMLDFDLGGEAFEAWHQAVETADPDLLARLIIEQSPSGGRHVVYRCQSAVSGNLKLAQRRQVVDGPDEVTICRQALPAHAKIATAVGTCC